MKNIKKEVKGVKEIIDKLIKFLRSGNLAGSFSEGCDCEKCNAYEKRLRLKLKKIILTPIKKVGKK